MENIGAIDIFDTKGTEYLFVIGYLLVLIVFWKFASRPVKLAGQIKNVLGIFTPNMMKVPQGLFFSKNHTWTHLEKSGIANVGLDDLLSHITGEISFNNIKAPGEIVHKGELLTEIGHDGKVLKISSPISGEVVDVNPMLEQEEGLLNEDPYGNGWICQIKPDNWVAETKSYYLAGEASSWAKKELERFKDFIAVSMQKHSPHMSNVVLQDGGELRDNTLANLPDGVWKDFQESFLEDLG